MNIINGCIPFIILCIVVFAVYKKTDIFDSFLDGVKSGIKNTVSIFPSLFALVFAVNLLKSSGALEMLQRLLEPLCNKADIPSEIIPLCFIKPLSGSGSNAYLNEILKTYNPDSIIGKISSVICGSTETTFYAIAIYFGAVKIKNTSYAVPCALTADIVGMALACAVVILFS